MPLSSRYSVIPSTEVIFFGAAFSAARADGLIASMAAATIRVFNSRKRGEITSRFLKRGQLAGKLPISVVGKIAAYNTLRRGGAGWFGWFSAECVAEIQRHRRQLWVVCRNGLFACDFC